MRRHVLTYERAGEDWEEFFVVDEMDGAFTFMITGCRPKPGIEIEDLSKRPADMHVTVDQALRDLKLLVIRPAQDLYEAGHVDKIRLDTDEAPTEEIPTIEVQHHGE
jgi:hypothetical protein